MKNNLKFYLMSALCSLALINSSGYSMNALTNTQQQNLKQYPQKLLLYQDNYITIEPSVGEILNQMEANRNNNLPNIGLENVGATCYMNATLQCFANIPGFLVPCIKDASKLNSKSLSADENAVKEFARIMAITNTLNDFGKLKNQNIQYYAPNKYKNAISRANQLFEGVQANDSKDLVNFIIMTGHEVLNKAQKNNIGNNNNFIIDQTNKQAIFNNFVQQFKQSNRSVYSDYFYAINHSVTECGNCHIQQHNYQTYFFLTFPLEEVRKYKQTMNTMNNNFNMFNMNNNFNINNNFNYNNNINNNLLNLSDCFDYDRQINVMNGDNSMYCNYCKTTGSSMMNTTLVTLPRTLILLLNRGKGIQFNVNVILPPVINLQNYVEYSNVLDTRLWLNGVICHIGESSMNGHFIAYARKGPDKQWYKYNDAIVTPATDDEINQVLNGTGAMTYLAFYSEFPNDSRNTTAMPNNNVNNYNYQNYSNNNIQQNYQQNYQQQQKSNNTNTVNANNNITIDMSVEQLNKQLNTTLGNNNHVLTQEEIFTNYPILYAWENNDLKAFDNLNQEQKKGILNKLLNETINFINQYSVVTNQILYQRFIKTWKQFLDYAIGKPQNDPQYSTLLTNISGIVDCFLPKAVNDRKIYIYNPKQLNIKNNNVDNLFEEFGKLNINNNNYIQESDKIDYSDISKVHIFMPLDELNRYVKYNRDSTALRKKGPLTDQELEEQYKTQAKISKGLLKTMNDVDSMTKTINDLLRETVHFNHNNSMPKNLQYGNGYNTFKNAWTIVVQELQNRSQYFSNEPKYSLLSQLTSNVKQAFFSR